MDHYSKCVTDNQHSKYFYQSWLNTVTNIETEKQRIYFQISTVFIFLCTILADIHTFLPRTYMSSQSTSVGNPDPEVISSGRVHDVALNCSARPWGDLWIRIYHWSTYVQIKAGIQGNWR
jgi:hypothetical protein